LINSREKSSGTRNRPRKKEGGKGRRAWSVGADQGVQNGEKGAAIHPDLLFKIGGGM